MQHPRGRDAADTARGSWTGAQQNTAMTSWESQMAESGLEGSLLEMLGIQTHVSYSTKGNKVGRGVHAEDDTQVVVSHMQGHYWRMR